MKNTITMTREAKEAMEKVERFNGTVEGKPKPIMPEPEPTTGPKTEKKAPAGKKKAETEKKAGTGKTAGRKAEVAEQKGPTPAELRKIRQEFNRRDGIIAKNVANIERSFLLIAFNLYFIRNKKLYKQAGFKNVYDYADERYNLGKTSCSNLISIVENYAERDEEGNVVEKIAETYTRFKQSQLVAMFGMSPEQIAKIDEKTSVRKINEIRKSKEIVQEDGEEGDRSEDGTEEEASGGAPGARMEKEILTQFSTYTEYLTNVEKIEKAMEKALKSHAGKVVIQVVYIK